MTRRLSDGIRHAMTKSSISYKPLFLNDTRARELEERHPWIVVVDAFANQVKELFLIDNPQYASEYRDTVYTSDAFKRYAAKKANAYTNVYYPWNCHLVRTVRAKDYFKLRTNRNRDLITAAEQKKLASFRVAVFGMSVGSNIALVFTQAGISREAVLADFDTLDTTNLNRIFGSAHQIGVNKSILAARRIYEHDPFAKIKILPEGVNEKDLASLLSRKAIDCIIDEIDSLPLKISIRQQAMEYGIPVLMVTDNGDGIVLHIERYDLGYKRVFHQDLPYWHAKLQELATEEGRRNEIAGAIIMDDIVGGAHLVDPRMLVSVGKVSDRKLVSWSQLGSAAMLGGVYVTYALKQIILGKDNRKEVRAHIDLRF